MIEESEEIFNILPTINHTMADKIVGIGNKTKNTPSPVATPFPPSNFKNGLKQCPRTLKKAIAHCVSIDSPK